MAHFFETRVEHLEPKKNKKKSSASSKKKKRIKTLTVEVQAQKWIT